ncbi:MAG: ATP-binding protein [Candidatus Peribacteria bacterium]|nr:ATP-binding protein [Candidatus Peribacteria bacterium]
MEFNYPDGTNSGLNFFVGENNTGKSTVFEAIDFLFN